MFLENSGVTLWQYTVQKLPHFSLQHTPGFQSHQPLLHMLSEALREASLTGVEVEGEVFLKNFAYSATTETMEL